MSHKQFLIGACLFFLLGGLGYADGYSPNVGEVLEYKIVLKSLVHGGNQTVRVVSKGVYNGRDVYNIRSEMMTVGLVKGFYDYAQSEELVLDADGLYPWFIKEEIREGKNSKREEVSFDYSRKIAVRLFSRNDEPPERTEIVLPGYVQDSLSLQFYLRREQTVNYSRKLYFYANGSVSENSFSVAPVSQKIELAGDTYQSFLQIADDVSKITVLVAADSPGRYPFIIKKMADWGMIEMKLVKIGQNL